MINAKNLHAKFVGHLKSINYTRSAAEKLFAKDDITKRDINFIYKGIFIEAITSFERYIEKLFLGYLCKRYASSLHNVNPRIDVKSTVVAYEIIKSAERYADWLPFDKTIKRSKSFFTGGLPFCTITPADKGDLEFISVIRNALAHDSKFSLNRFVTEAQKRFPMLTIAEQKPINFLRSLHSRGPAITHFEILISKISTISSSFT